MKLVMKLIKEKDIIYIYLKIKNVINLTNLRICQINYIFNLSNLRFQIFL